MESKSDILNELKSLSPLIAQMDKGNVFAVPPGYFDTISPTVLACLQEERPISGGRIPPGFPAVPEGYFDQLADTIFHRIKAGETAKEETRNLSPLLADLQDKNVFGVPPGYFTAFPAAIARQLERTEAKEELRAVSPLLFSLRGKATLETPVDYFSAFPDKMLRKVSAAPARVVVMHKPGRWIQYAVAAMLTGVTALGVYKYIDERGARMDNNHPTAIQAPAVIEEKQLSDRQFKEAIENLNNADIARYLENNGDITDVAVLNNNVDESKLPSPDDYLIDAATLDNYLKEIEKAPMNN